MTEFQPYSTEIGGLTVTLTQDEQYHNQFSLDIPQEPDSAGYLHFAISTQLMNKFKPTEVGWKVQSARENGMYIECYHTKQLEEVHARLIDMLDQIGSLIPDREVLDKFSMLHTLEAKHQSDMALASIADDSIAPMREALYQFIRDHHLGVDEDAHGEITDMMTGVYDQLTDLSRERSSREETLTREQQDALELDHYMKATTAYFEGQGISLNHRQLESLEAYYEDGLEDKHQRGY